MHQLKSPRTAVEFILVQFSLFLHIAFCPAFLELLSLRNIIINNDIPEAKYKIVLVLFVEMF